MVVVLVEVVDGGVTRVVGTTTGRVVGETGAPAIGGPVVVVEAALPSETFTAEGKTYRYHNGMNGVAEVRVRSEKILFTLVPGLKALFNDV